MAFVLLFLASLLEVALFSRFPVLFETLSQDRVGRWAIPVPGTVIWILTAMYFARSETLRNFIGACGLLERPTNRVWIGVVIAVGFQIGLILCSLVFPVSSNGNRHVWFQRMAQLDYGDLVFLVHVAAWTPLWEETVMRGFLFRAFRGTYRFVPSALLIIVLMIVTHYKQTLHSWIATAGISLMAGLMCWVREKSSSLWDCIACHAAFNGTAAVWGWIS